MPRVRRPAVAGLFYPDDPAELEMAVQGYLAAAGGRGPLPGPPPKALVVPHAGFVYSGPVAASAYRALAPIRNAIRRVVLLGPSHRVLVSGLAASSAGSFITPLGEIPVDARAVARALELPQVVRQDAAHAREHSLEVQLPFLQCALDRFSLAPFSVGDATAEEVAELLDLLWGGPETLIVISTDLSHYYDYETARKLDADTTLAIEELRPEALGPESACGRVPLRGMLTVARRRALGVRTLDVRSSGDTAGPPSEVVGYGAYLIA